MLLVVAFGVYFTQRSFGGRKQQLAESGSAGSGSTIEVPRIGGTLVEGDIGTPTTLNPLLARSQTEQDLATLMFEGLVKVDGTGMPRADLAETWDISKDGKTYTVKLRSGVTWHDGAPFTSQDVRFTISLVKASDFPGSPQLSQFWRPIVVDTPDNGTVVFHLLEPFSPFLNYLNLPILPKHILGGVFAQDLATDPFNASPVGTGPFRFVSFDRSAGEIQLTAFARFYGDKPNLNGVTIRYFDNSDKLVAALKGGSIQATGTLSADQLLRTGVVPRNDAVYAPPLMSYTALFFNTRVAPFTDQTVRQAIQSVIDVTELTNGPLKSQVVAGVSPIPETSWAFAAQKTAFDPAQASAMLEKAGWKFVEKDGVLEKGDSILGFQLLVNADDPQRLLMAQTIAQQLGGIHVRVEVQPTTSDNVVQLMTSGQYAAAVFGGHYVNGDPDCLDVWQSTAADTGLNVTGINDAVIDKALQDARHSPDVNKRRQLYARFQQEFVAQAPAVILYYPRYLFVVSSGIHGVKPDPIVEPSDRFQHISSWYFEGQAAPSGTP